MGAFSRAATQSYGAGMRISDIVNTLAVKNRFVDAEVELVHDGETVAWAPGEVKHLPPDYANWFIRKSTLQRNRQGKPTIQSLVVIGPGGSGKPEEALYVKDFEGRRELIDRSTGPTTGFDNDGTPMTAKIIEVDGVTGIDSEEMRANGRDVERHRTERAVNEAETGRKVEAEFARNADVTDEQIERAARLISEGKGKAVEAGQVE